MLNPRKVVVTGMGMLTAVGLDRDSSWSALKRGVGGVAPITSLDAGEFKTGFAAELKGFDPEAAMDPKDARKADRYAQIAVAAAAEAMAQAKLDAPTDPYRAGVIIGSGIGGMITFEEQHGKLVARGPRAVSPLFIPMMISDMAAGLVSIRYGFKGANFCTVSACASGGHAIGAAYDQIVLGHADVMITGGAEAAISSMALAGFGNMKALSTRNDEPQRARRPFDADRDGFVMGEGGGGPGPGVRGARQGARRRDPGRDRRLRHDRRRLPHDPARQRRRRRDRLDARGPAQRRPGSGGHRLHQRPRHLDPLQRQDRDRRPSARSSATTPTGCGSARPSP